MKVSGTFKPKSDPDFGLSPSPYAKKAVELDSKKKSLYYSTKKVPFKTSTLHHNIAVRKMSRSKHLYLFNQVYPYIHFFMSNNKIIEFKLFGAILTKHLYTFLVNAMTEICVNFILVHYFYAAYYVFIISWPHVILR
jgi:hypothetical protein